MIRAFKNTQINYSPSPKVLNTTTLIVNHSGPQSSTVFLIASRVALVTQKDECFDWPFENECAIRYNILPFYA